MLTLIVPQESGSNENNNKLIDEFIKKKTMLKLLQSFLDFTYFLMKDKYS